MILRRKHRGILLVTAAALLFQLLLPFFAVYRLPGSSGPRGLASLFGDKVIICTADGFRLASWDELAKGKNHPKPHEQYQCALCYVAAHGLNKLLAPGAITLAGINASGSVDAFYAYQPAAFYLPSSFYSRAPPSILL